MRQKIFAGTSLDFQEYYKDRNLISFRDLKKILAFMSRNPDLKNRVGGEEEEKYSKILYERYIAVMRNMSTEPSLLNMQGDITH